MKTISPKPVDSWIVEENIPRTRRYSWLPPLSASFHVFRVFWLLVYACCWLISAVATWAMIMNGGDILFLILVSFLLTTVCCAWFAAPLVRIRPESITLDDTFRYDPGNLSSAYQSAGLFFAYFTKRKSRRLAIPRVALTIQLTDDRWHGDKRRLLVDTIGGAMEIASDLTDAEREWLFDAIMEWRSGIPIA